MSDSYSRPTRRTLILRGLLGLSIVVALLIGPVVGQVFGVRTGNVFQKWQMFTGKGRKTCQLNYSQVTIGSRSSLDHAEILGFSKSKRPVRIEKKQIPQINRAMCLRVARAAKQPRVDLRLSARCGSRGSWRIVSSGVVDVCAR